MRNDLDVLYDRWFGSKNSVSQELLQKHNFSPGVAPAVMIRHLFESASHHVAVQSDGFYQTLRAAYQGNPSAGNVIDFLLQDLKMMRVELFAFGEHYLGDRPASQIKVSQTDWAHLTAVIAQRIALEENQLDPLLKS